MKQPPRLTIANPASKIGPVSTDRNVAQRPAPSTEPLGGEIGLAVFTYFTKLPTALQQQDVLYNADQMWSSVTLTLETAGPVAVGTSASIVPVLSGKGQLLQTGVPTTFTVAKSKRLYIASTSVNRIKVTVAPYPWLESIVGILAAGPGAIGAALSSLFRK